MRRISKSSSLLVLALLGGAGCTDRVPTLTDPDFFPGSLPRTIQHTLSTDVLLGTAEVVPGRTTVEDAFYKLIARNFDGSLNAHLLAQFNGFPEKVTVSGTDYATFAYENSRVVASLPDTLRVSGSFLEFQLWTVEQAFDSVNVSWQNAVDLPGQTVPWTTAGGSRGQLLATDIWNVAETGAESDSLKWDIPAAIVEALADSSLPGLMVVLSTPNSRAEISSLVVEARIRPEAQDTVVTQSIQSLAQTFIYTPVSAPPADILRAGGITSDRSLLRLRLDNPLVGCTLPTPDCPAEVDIKDVTLNRVELLLETAPVTLGFRPITPTRLTFRRLLEPELGPRATLGEILAEDTVTASRFLPGTTGVVSFNVTNAVNLALSAGRDELALALLIEPDASTPSYAWMQRNPRLRFTYTLPQRPQLP